MSILPDIIAACAAVLRVPNRDDLAALLQEQPLAGSFVVAVSSSGAVRLFATAAAAVATDDVKRAVSVAILGAGDDFAIHSVQAASREGGAAASTSLSHIGDLALRRQFALVIAAHSTVLASAALPQEERLALEAAFAAHVAPALRLGAALSTAGAAAYSDALARSEKLIFSALLRGGSAGSAGVVSLLRKQPSALVALLPLLHFNATVVRRALGVASGESEAAAAADQQQHSVPQQIEHVFAQIHNEVQGELTKQRAAAVDATEASLVAACGGSTSPSALLAQTALAHHRLAQRVATLVAQRDLVMRRGWRRLLALRDTRGRWTLDERLASAFTGAPVDELYRRAAASAPHDGGRAAELLAGDPEVYGTALALVCLERMFPDDLWKWNGEVESARKFLSSPAGAGAAEKSVMAIVKDVVLQLRIVQHHEAQLRAVEDSSTFYRAVVAKRDDALAAWSAAVAEAQAAAGFWDDAAEHFVKHVCVLRSSKTALAVNFPFDFFERVVEGEFVALDRLVSRTAGFRTVCSALRRVYPIAATLRDLLDGYYCYFSNQEHQHQHRHDGKQRRHWRASNTMEEHDLLLAALPEEYAAVQALFLEGGTRLCWAGSAQAAAEFAERLCAAVARLTQRGDAVRRIYTRVRCLIAALASSTSIALSSVATKTAHHQPCSVQLAHLGAELREFSSELLAIEAAIESIAPSRAAHVFRLVRSDIDAALSEKLVALAELFTDTFAQLSTASSRPATLALCETNVAARVRVAAASSRVALEPSAASVRKHWLAVLNSEFLGVLCSVRCPAALLGPSTLSSSSRTFAYLLSTGNGALERALGEAVAVVNGAADSLSEALAAWQREYSLWNIELEVLFRTLEGGGDDGEPSRKLDEWLSVVDTLRESSRRAFAVSATTVVLRGCEISIDELQRAVQSRGTAVVRRVLERFAQTVLASATGLRAAIRKHRDALEGFDPARAIEDCVGFMSASASGGLAVFVDTSAPAHIDAIQRCQLGLRQAVSSGGDAGASSVAALLPRDAAPWIESDVLATEFRALRDLYLLRKEIVDGRAAQLLQHLDTTGAQLARSMAQLNADFRAQDLDAAASGDGGGNGARGEAAAKAAEFRDTAARHVAEAERLTATQRTLFGSAPTPELADGLRLAKAVAADAGSLCDVFAMLAAFYDELEQLRRTLFFAMTPARCKEVFVQLADLEKRLATDGAATRTYLSHQRMARLLRSLAPTNGIVNDLRSAAFSASDSLPVASSSSAAVALNAAALRHWNGLKRALHGKGNLPAVFASPAAFATSSAVTSAVTLGDIWDCDVAAGGSNHAAFVAAIEAAQGEYALEKFLAEVRTFWDEAALETFVYGQQQQQQQQRRSSGGGPIIFVRGWYGTSAQEKLADHLVALHSLKTSPHFHHFETEAVAMEARLAKLRDSVEALLDVQRRWIYLDGIFSPKAGSASSDSIRQQLPQESFQFEKITGELLRVLPTSDHQQQQSWLSFFVHRNEKLLPSLEQIAKELSVVERALLAYLETQRAAFPRFYFVGDDDLLEILGGGVEPAAVARHLPNMFGGAKSFLFDDSGGSVDRVVSNEGETLPLLAPLDAKSDDAQRMGIVKWLERFGAALQATLGAAIQNHPFASGSASTNVVDMLHATPSQVADVVLQMRWTRDVEARLTSKSALSEQSLVAEIELLAKANTAAAATTDGPAASSHCERLKRERVITMLVYHRDVTRALAAAGVAATDDFRWLRVMRYYPAAAQASTSSPTVVRIADAAFSYSCEYLGVPERLVQTPLTDKAFLTLTQALHTKSGGSAQGPAGTGKTETVRQLAQQLGRLSYVFCCDEQFSLSSMERIFVGLCEVGAWGCFDEFNRLEERLLSAVSQQILVIQNGLRSSASKVDFAGVQRGGGGGGGGGASAAARAVRLHPHVGIFVTMNPDYAGRSQLPDNLKALFRPLHMAAADRENIAEVMLFVRGFRHAEALARKVVPLFRLCAEQLSKQHHYDWGLRALKSVLQTAGTILRDKRQEQNAEEQQLSFEARVLLQALSETVTPKLVGSDAELYGPLLRDVFPDIAAGDGAPEQLRRGIERYCAAHGLVASEQWVAKALQLYSILGVHHGAMVVGASATGKSAAWRALFSAMAEGGGLVVTVHIIDPKAVTKTALFGSLEPSSREWRDGCFTAILRKLSAASASGAPAGSKAAARHFIVFDGDVDPEWVENLNSVLDDNKLLTLPTGERIALPRNVQILFEAADLKHATLATVSRCGMVWFPADTLDFATNLVPSVSRRAAASAAAVSGAQRGATATSSSLYKSMLSECGVHLVFGAGTSSASSSSSSASAAAEGLHARFLELIAPELAPAGLVSTCFAIVAREWGALSPIMEWNPLQALRSVFAQLFAPAHTPLLELCVRRGAADIAQRLLAFALMWGIGASFSTADRAALFESKLAVLRGLLPQVNASSSSVFDFTLDASDGSWVPWPVPPAPAVVDSALRSGATAVIPTVDTVRHEAVLANWLRCAIGAHSPPVFLLAGPPGSAKTLSVTAVLERHASEFDAIFLNFSSATSPEMLLRALEPVTVIAKQQQMNHTHSQQSDASSSSSTQSSARLVMRPASQQRRLVVFCDEINLPSPDHYGTMRVVQFLRQIVEHGGFFRSAAGGTGTDFVAVEDIQFVGACNSPSDPGRHALPHRFLRWAPVLFVDFPSAPSLLRIYSAYTQAALRRCERVRSAAGGLAAAMVAVYDASRARFRPDVQKHYIYSPRELSRWVRALSAALDPLPDEDAAQLSPEQLVRLAVHEGLRVFCDRLVSAEEQEWTNAVIDKAFTTHLFPSSSSSSSSSPSADAGVLRRPLLFSSLLSRHYAAADMPRLRRFLQEKLRLFSEEEYDARLVVFDAVVEHVLRIDRVLRQPLGHMVLAGASGTGKKALTRFAAWLSGTSVFQLRTHRGYTLDHFQQDLRSVMRRAGVEQERICFIFDESNVLDSGFLEFMNALLASGDVPGLFEGDERAKLMQQIRAAAAASSSSSSSSSSLRADADENACYAWFIANVSRCLHVVFTMNPQNQSDAAARATASPALFNRCVIDWFGTWDAATMLHVALALTNTLPIAAAAASLVDGNNEDEDVEEGIRSCLASALQRIHDGVDAAVFGGGASSIAALSPSPTTTAGASSLRVTPRHFVDLIHHFGAIFTEKRESIVQLQRHLLAGLTKLGRTASAVEEQMGALRSKEAALAATSAEAAAMLERIVAETARAEKARADASVLARRLAEEQHIIAEKRADAERQLSGAQPALEAAASALSTVKPEYLREIRAYSKPPPAVKAVLEAVVVILGERSTEWDVVKGYIRRDDFIAFVRSFQPSDVSTWAQDYVRKNYLADPKFTPEEAMKASRAAGPLVQWVHAQCRFAEINVGIAPLRASIEQLTAEVKEKQVLLDRAQAVVAECDATLARLKTEYQGTMQRQTAIQADIDAVAKRCQRASALVSNLAAERTRWESDAGALRQQASSQLGDCVLAAAFVVYAGPLEESARHAVFRPVVTDVLRQQEQCRPRSVACLFGNEYAGPAQRPLDLVEYLAPKAAVRAKWHGEGKLPQCTQCVENAIILTRAQRRRYCLVVDPTGQAAAFLRTCMSAADEGAPTTSASSSTCQQTSFSDKNLLKTIEMSVRFGNTIVVNDAEQVDPVLNPLLNREWRRVGGRVLLRLGAADVDMAPSFRMVLATRDAHAGFAPDLCGRVAFVNFTTTRGSLSSQMLHAVLQREQPEVARVRADLTATRAEKESRLRALEDSLLDAIAATEAANILENNELLQTLETLKRESSAIAEQMSALQRQLDTTVADVERAFRPIAQCAADAHFLLADLAALDPTFYRFSLDLVRDTLYASLPSASSSGGSGSVEPSSIVVRRFLGRLHTVVLRGIFEHDHAAVQLRLCQLFTDTAGGVPSTLWNFLLERLGGEAAPPSASSSSAAGQPPLVSPAQRAQLELLARTEPQIFGALAADILSGAPAWREYLAGESDSVGEGVITPLQDRADAIVAAAPGGTRHPAALVGVVNMCLVKILRPAQLLAAAHYLLSCVFDHSYDCNDGKSHHQAGAELDFDEHLRATGVVPIGDQSAVFDLGRFAATLDCFTPALLVSFAGYDPTPRVAALASSQQLLTAAMGTAEGLVVAQRHLDDGMRLGRWVLLLNVHFSAPLLAALEKRLHLERSNASGSKGGGGGVHRDFRLFLACEHSPAVPPSLTAISRVFVFEAPKGIKANMGRSLDLLIEQQRQQQQQQGAAAPPPAELARILFVTAWLHSTIVERLRYVPVGWTKRFEFSSADFARCAALVASWVGAAAGARRHIDPRRDVPWAMLRQLICTTVYGARVDSPFDERLVHSLADACISEAMFEPDFSLVVGPDVNCEAGSTLADFAAWVQQLPDVEPPEWLGLPAWATQLALTQRGRETTARWAAVQTSRIVPTGSGPAHSSVERQRQQQQQQQVRGSAQSEAEDALRGALQTTAAVAARAQQDASALFDSVDALVAKCSNGATAATTSWWRPLLMCLEREAQAAKSLLCGHVGPQLQQLAAAVAGTARHTNESVELAQCLRNNAVPPEWRSSLGETNAVVQRQARRQGGVAATVGLSAWLAAVAQRLAALLAWVRDAAASGAGADGIVRRLLSNVPLGSCFFPAPLLTATRQCFARSRAQPIERTQLKVLLFPQKQQQQQGRDDDRIVLTGMQLQGSTLSQEPATASDGEQREHFLVMPVEERHSFENVIVALEWQSSDSHKPLSSSATKNKRVTVPAYATEQRQELLFAADVLVDQDVFESVWQTRQVCIVSRR